MIKVSAKVTSHQSLVPLCLEPTVCPSGQDALAVLLASMSPRVSGTNEGLSSFG